MIHLAYCCPRCDAPINTTIDAGTRSLECPKCGQKSTVPEGAVADDRVHRCVVCPSTDLYVRKNFSQRAGVTMVVIGMIVSSIFWYNRQIYLTYGTLFVMALVDVVLYFSLGNLLQCYRCQAQYRGMAELEGHVPFDLEMHERHRQQAARLADAAKR
jgi:DNA-directed RNA polymerase subunit RPC12/RpoP